MKTQSETGHEDTGGRRQDMKTQADTGHEDT